MRHVYVTVTVKAKLIVNDTADNEVCAKNYAASLIGLEKQYKAAYRVSNDYTKVPLPTAKITKVE